ncbi:RNA polymerase sigma factor RpoH [Candidatus Nitrosacidococcus tergens]|uniref:RNA polymerase sigma factor n=1 Tax=Candidatus Nitrosacidococcus tergens TaxID=553981 RepID=A0A7G1QAS2_9GAMM|nr:RNA polymerase sigma factor RpoH [Candidatus Nitrosacidococcus tergens]CAB1276745.1 RNA polymerase, sigma 32 (sigma H) factor [Candidatus Nitrosacidococcus tergens]
MDITLSDNNRLMPSITSNNSLDSYYREISNIPVLSADQEYELACRLRDGNDLEAARWLILSHLRFVAYIARGYTGYGLALTDLIQEGNIGLMKAVKRFDPAQKVRLVSFAVYWIRAEIHEFIIRNWRIVRIATTKTQRKLFFKLRSTKKHLGWLNTQERNEIAAELAVSPEHVMEMEARLSAQDNSYDIKNEDEEYTLAPVNYLTDISTDPAYQLEQLDYDETYNKRLQQALASLDERSLDIVNQRWLTDSKSTLHDLAAKHKISAERVRQLENNAMKKLRDTIGN